MTTVYYSGHSNLISDIAFEQPESALKSMDAEALKASELSYCPAFKDHYHNTFSLKWAFDYSLKIEPNGNLKTDDYNQDFFDQTVTIRNYEHRIYTLAHFYHFWCEEPLMMEVLPVTGTSNDFTSNIDFYSAQFDVGKWFRPIECAFKAKPKSTQIIVNQGDPYCFVRFQSKEKIKLKRFIMTDEIKKLELEFMSLRNLNSHATKGMLPSLNYYYEKLRHSGYSKHLTKLIKDNEV